MNAIGAERCMIIQGNNKLLPRGESWWDEGSQYSHYSVQQVPSGKHLCFSVTGLTLISLHAPWGSSDRPGLKVERKEEVYSGREQRGHAKEIKVVSSWYVIQPKDMAKKGVSVREKGGGCGGGVGTDICWQCWEVEVERWKVGESRPFLSFIYTPPMVRKCWIKYLLIFRRQACSC